MGKKSKRFAGFTLIELLLVVGIIATLAVVVFVALDPAKRFADARDAKRTTDVETILSAVNQYVVDHKGAFPNGLDHDERQIGTSGDNCSISSGGCSTTSSACIDLNKDDQIAKYLKEIPTDPDGGTAEMTKYTIGLDSNNIITIKACGAEGDNEISISR